MCKHPLPDVSLPLTDEASCEGFTECVDCGRLNVEAFVRTILKEIQSAGKKTCKDVFS